MKIRSVGGEYFHADGRRSRHDEADIRFTQFCEAPETGSQFLFCLFLCQSFTNNFMTCDCRVDEVLWN